MSRAFLTVLAAAALAACGSQPLEGGPAGGADGGGIIPDGRHHPTNWAQAEHHGLALKTQSEDCRECHGGDLRGGGSAPVGCDGCHTPDWRTGCTYCHGGTDNPTGAPPRDLSGQTGRTLLTFPAHTVHVSDGTNHKAFDCTACHVKPTDVLSQDHVFDDTPGKAELSFGAGLSPSGTYATGTCSNLYCHGNGVSSNGTSRTTDGPKGCGNCHATRPNTGAHSRHGNLACYECHGDTVNTSGAIVRPELHVNGRKDTRFGTSNIVLSSGRCSGTCHGEGHSGQRW